MGGKTILSVENYMSDSSVELLSQAILDFTGPTFIWQCISHCFRGGQAHKLGIFDDGEVLHSVEIENIPFFKGYNILVGGFNQFEKSQSNWKISPGKGENKTYLKPPPSI